jgi:NAD(P)H-dependent FMN reductase
MLALPRRRDNESLPFTSTRRNVCMTLQAMDAEGLVGSTREGRFSGKPTRWLFEHLKRRGGVEARPLDLRDFPMPFFDQAAPPATPDRAPYDHETVRRWTAEIAASGRA